jgi:hypothetical protein
VHFGNRSRFGFIRQTVQDVERRDHVKATALEGDGRDRGLCKPAMAMMPGEFEAASSQIEANRVAVFLEQSKVGAGAASAIEQPRLGNAGSRLCE